jgi:hypothetical protein
MNTTDFQHLIPGPDRQLVSTGFVCQLLQILPKQMYVLMEDCEIQFQQIVDGVGFLLLADAERVAEKCGDVRKEIHDKLSAAKDN